MRLLFWLQKESRAWCISYADVSNFFSLAFHESPRLSISNIPKQPFLHKLSLQLHPKPIDGSGIASKCLTLSDHPLKLPIQIFNKSCISFVKQKVPLLHSKFSFNRKSGCSSIIRRNNHEILWKSGWSCHVWMWLLGEQPEFRYGKSAVRLKTHMNFTFSWTTRAGLHQSQR